MSPSLKSIAASDVVDGKPLLFTDLEEIGEGKKFVICPTGSEPPALSLRSPENSEVVWRLWSVLGWGDARGEECAEVDEAFDESSLGNANCGEGEFSTWRAGEMAEVDP